MDCSKLADNINLFGYNGACISTEESHLLQNSLLLLQQDNHFRRTFYWGRLNGAQNDYHIAYGYEKDVLSGQIYFYSLDGIEWLLMPKANKCSRFLAPLAVTAFEGDPAIVTNVYNANPPFPPNEEESSPQFPDGSIPKELKEEDRLAAIVELINMDSAIIPRGGWSKDSGSGEIHENMSFEGLTKAEAINEKFYLHARIPQRKWIDNLLSTSRPDYNYAIDFLDPIDIDVPKGCWKLRLHNGEHLAILQNLYWPGMTVYHKVNTPHYGALYIGHGIKNLDVPFMI